LRNEPPGWCEKNVVFFFNKRCHRAMHRLVNRSTKNIFFIFSIKNRKPLFVLILKL
jgi:hypothetical protein